MGTYAGAGSIGRAAAALDAGLADCGIACCAACGSSSKIAFLIRSMNGMCHILTASILFPQPGNTPLHSSGPSATGHLVPNRFTSPLALYPIDKRTLAFYSGYAAIVDRACLPFNKEIAAVSHSNNRQSPLPRCPH